MVQITIEYMILIPVLILQLFLFPFVVTTVMNTWADSRRTLELQEIAGHLGSSIQQVYFSLNHTTIQATSPLTSKLDIPLFIENYVYTGNATLRTVQDPDLESTQVLDVTLKYVGLGISATTSVTLGQNVEWKTSKFTSNSTQACITAVKFSNETIQLYFGTAEG
jgi:hypothetical protein